MAGEGYRVEILPPEAVPGNLTGLKHISDAWLSAKKSPEKRFSLGCFDAAYLAETPLALVRDPAGEVCAFANLWAAAGREELSVDLMRGLPQARPGVMDFLFVELMLWGQGQGYAHFNLGMAPLAGLENRWLAPAWARMAHAIFRHGEHFHGLRGLRQYKQKFGPVWKPKYLAAPGGLSLPFTIMNLANLISHGLGGIAGRGAGRAPGKQRLSLAGGRC